MQVLQVQDTQLQIVETTVETHEVQTAPGTQTTRVWELLPFAI